MRSRIAICAVAILTLAWLAPSSGQADIFVPSTAMHGSTIAEVFIGQQEIVTRLEIGIEDLPVFSDLLPEEARSRLGLSPEPRDARLQRFLSEGWTYQFNSGRLQGELVKIGPSRRILRDSVTGLPVDDQPEDRPVVVVALLKHDLPLNIERLTIHPPLNEDGRSSADIGLSVSHGDVTVNDFRFLAEPEALVLDRSDPWYTRFENRVFWRQAQHAMAVYITITPFEIRKELLLRLKDIATALDLSLPQHRVLPLEDRERFLDAVSLGLADRLPLVVDGEPMPMNLDRIEFLDRTLRRTESLTEAADLLVETALIGVIYSAPVSARPESVNLHWDLFTDRVQAIPVVFIDEAAGPPWQATTDEPVVSWKNVLVSDAAYEILPVPDEDATGSFFSKFFNLKPSESPDTEDLGPKLAQLLRNLHLIQQMQAPAQRDDAIQITVTEQAREQTLQEVGGGLSIEIAGGGKARVDRVTLTELRAIQPKAGGGFTAATVWSGRARAGHWGHAHRREIVFEGLVDIASEEGYWKIDGLTVTNKAILD